MTNVTIKDIAEHAGVSYATVSRTLNHRAGVNPNTAQRIFTAAEELGYRPNLAARSLKTNRTRTLTLVIPDIANPFFADIALAVNEYAFKNGYTVMLCSSAWNPEIERGQIEQLINQRVDGIIYKPAGDVPQYFRDLSIPKVIISTRACEGDCWIEADNRQGGFSAGKLLGEKGYQRIAFIGSHADRRSNIARLRGLTEGLAENGLRVEPSRVRYGDFTIESGYALAQAMMEETDPPDAFFCFNDLIALGVLQFLNESGRNVPEEVGVIGFDDIPIAALPQIQLTSVAQPRKEMGKQAAELLIDALESGGELSPQHFIIPTRLIQRRSTRA